MKKNVMLDKKQGKGYPNKSVPPFPKGVIDVCWSETTMQVYLTFANNKFILYPPHNPQQEDSAYDI